jgi:type IV pilus assembly protein PilP
MSRMTMQMKTVFGVALCVALWGCVADVSDLRAFVDEAKNQPQAPIKLLPPSPEYKAEEFSAAGKSDPFYPQKPVVISAQTINANEKAPSPDGKHVKGLLESYELEELKRVGVLIDPKKKPVLWLQTPDKKVHSVTVGQFVGPNYGKVININAKKVVIREQWYEGDHWVAKDVVWSMDGE